MVGSRIHHLALTALCCSALAFPAPKTFDVDCTRGEKIGRALERAEPGDTIRITGLCEEKVVIATDGITITGSGSSSSAAIVRGGTVQQGTEHDGLLTVDGARNVTVRNLTIQRSRAEGIFATHGAALAVESVTLEDNAGSGLGATSSRLEIMNLTARRNWVGVDLSTGTHVVARGRIVANDNQLDGIFVGGASSLEIRGAHVEANNNNGGLVALGNSHIAFWTFQGPSTRGASISVSRNRVNGIALINASMEIYSEAASITATENPAGITILGPGALASPFPQMGVRILLERNGIGLNLGARAAAVIIGGLTARNNITAGVVAEDSSLTLVSPPPNPSMVSANALDLDARFGARLTVDGVTFATKKCDLTVLTRGVPGCP